MFNIASSAYFKQIWSPPFCSQSTITVKLLIPGKGEEGGVGVSF